MGCGGDEESPPPRPAVVATKIKNAAPKPAAASQPAKTGKVNGKAQTSKNKPAGKVKTASGAADAVSGDKAAAVKESDEASIQKTMDNIKKEAASGADSIYRARFYNPEGKIDPFEAPFKKEIRSTPADDKRPEEQLPDRIRQTPLEMIDLSQLTLVGVIRFPSGYRAIVEERSGKGYTVKVGTYVGTNYGRITEIQKDRVIIQEKVRNVLGKVKDQKSQLKLQKPLGEN